MDAQAQLVAIAHACELRFETDSEWGWMGWTDKDGNRLKDIPDYLHDLNAIHAAVVQWCDDPEKKLKYHRRLSEVVGRGTPNFPGYNVWDAENATAAQRAEAFLRTIGKWKEEG